MNFTDDLVAKILDIFFLPIIVAVDAMFDAEFKDAFLSPYQGLKEVGFDKDGQAPWWLKWLYSGLFWAILVWLVVSFFSLF